MNKKKWVNSKIIFTITMVFVVCCFMATSLWAQYCDSEYCESRGEPAQIFLTRVEVADLNNSSGKEGYGDFTYMTAHLTQGKTYSVYLVENYGLTGFQTGWKMWIDYNGDEDFDDEGEEVLSAYMDYHVPGCFTVPCCTIIGNTRMRVTVGIYYEPSCGYIGHGEVEDYTVNITGNPEFHNVGNTNVFSSISYSANRRAMPFTMPENGRISSVTMYHNEPIYSPGNMKLAVYEGTGLGAPGNPYHRLAITKETDVSCNAGWQSICLINPVWVAEGQKIWLAWVYQYNPGIRYESGSPGRFEPDEDKTWPHMPDPVGSGTQANYIYSIYATYHRCDD